MVRYCYNSLTDMNVLVLTEAVFQTGSVFIE